jgi:hypothetical protein
VVERVENGDLLFEEKGETSSTKIYDRTGKEGFNGAVV